VFRIGFEALDLRSGDLTGRPGDRNVYVMFLAPETESVQLGFT
jgi:hypothetical protein